MALLFITSGDSLPLEPTWRAFLEAAGRLAFRHPPPAVPPAPSITVTLEGEPLHPPLPQWPENEYPDWKLRRGLPVEDCEGGGDRETAGGLQVADGGQGTGCGGSAGRNSGGRGGAEGREARRTGGSAVKNKQSASADSSRKHSGSGGSSNSSSSGSGSSNSSSGSSYSSGPPAAPHPTPAESLIANLTAQLKAAASEAGMNERLRPGWRGLAPGVVPKGRPWSKAGLVPGILGWESDLLVEEHRRLLSQTPCLGGGCSDGGSGGKAAGAGEQVLAAAMGVGGGGTGLIGSGFTPRAVGGGNWRSALVQEQKGYEPRQQQQRQQQRSLQLDPVYTRQRLFSIYVHPPPGLQLPAGSLFSGLELPEVLRVNTTQAYAQHAVAQAELALLRAALFDRSNVKFVLVSDSSIPIYQPEVRCVVGWARVRLSVITGGFALSTSSRLDGCPGGAGGLHPAEGGALLGMPQLVKPPHGHLPPATLTPTYLVIITHRPPAPHPCGPHMAVLAVQVVYTQLMVELQSRLDACKYPGKNLDYRR